jgi:hypothetical protein
MGDFVRKMAHDFYGYGRWSAPYWFIGPEQGGDGNEERAKAFSELGKDGLCDCKEFHKAINEFRWHREPPEEAKLQPTWRRLMLLLMPSLKLGTDPLALRRYQSRDWGMHEGETCVIELGGLAAKSFRTPIDRQSFREGRIKSIKERLNERIRQTDPYLRLVVMYGSSSRVAWKSICGYDFSKGGLLKHEKTVFAFMPSPTWPGQWDEEWIDLGVRIALG